MHPLGRLTWLTACWAIALGRLLSTLAIAAFSTAALANTTGQLGPPADTSSIAVSQPGYPPGLHLLPGRPHPAVARIVVPEGNATSYGSGTLVDARGQYGLVITNWHVVRDGHGDVDVVFPDGFQSKARPLKVDKDWDLAALVIWRPPAPPVKMTMTPPQPGDELTICGYGSGQYRAATGRCTQYFAPSTDLPQHLVELNVEARQGDSGGPIFNDRGELAGVLFGAGRGTTLGSFGGRVGTFLATLAPDIGHANEVGLAAAQAPDVNQLPVITEPTTPQQESRDQKKPAAEKQLAARPFFTAPQPGEVLNHGWHAVAAKSKETSAAHAAKEPTPIALDVPLKKLLAAAGALAFIALLVRGAR